MLFYHLEGEIIVHIEKTLDIHTCNQWVCFADHLFGVKMMEEDDDIAGPLPIEKLADAGINASDIKKLKAQGMFTVESVCFN